MHWTDHLQMVDQESVDEVDNKKKDIEEYTVKDYLAYGKRFRKRSHEHKKTIDKAKLKKHKNKNKRTVANVKLMKIKRKDGEDAMDAEKRGYLMKMF